MRRLHRREKPVGVLERVRTSRGSLPGPSVLDGLEQSGVESVSRVLFKTPNTPNAPYSLNVLLRLLPGSRAEASNAAKPSRARVV